MLIFRLTGKPETGASPPSPTSRSGSEHVKDVSERSELSLMSGNGTGFVEVHPSSIPQRRSGGICGSSFRRVSIGIIGGVPKPKRSHCSRSPAFLNAGLRRWAGPAWPGSWTRHVLASCQPNESERRRSGRAGADVPAPQSEEKENPRGRRRQTDCRPSESRDSGVKGRPLR